MGHHTSSERPFLVNIVHHRVVWKTRGPPRLHLPWASTSLNPVLVKSPRVCDNNSINNCILSWWKHYILVGLVLLPRVPTCTKIWRFTLQVLPLLCKWWESGTTSIDDISQQGMVQELSDSNPTLPQSQSHHSCMYNLLLSLPYYPVFVTFPSNRTSVRAWTTPQYCKRRRLTTTLNIISVFFSSDPAQLNPPKNCLELCL
jgi:hypothetical protein